MRRERGEAGWRGGEEGVRGRERGKVEMKWQGRVVRMPDVIQFVHYQSGGGHLHDSALREGFRLGPVLSLPSQVASLSLEVVAPLRLSLEPSLLDRTSRFSVFPSRPAFLSPPPPPPPNPTTPPHYHHFFLWTHRERGARV